MISVGNPSASPMMQNTIKSKTQETDSRAKNPAKAGYKKITGGQIKDILARLLVKAWAESERNLLMDIRNVLQDSDFKLTSQANHLSKLLNLLSEVQRQSHHLQRLYKRRRINKDSGMIESNWDILRFGTYSPKDVK